MNTQTIFDFDKNSDIQAWDIVDHIVMGGKSSSTFKLNDDGYGVFEGSISLENNGGFSSVRYRFNRLKVNEGSSIIINLKGDGKNYQLRVKDKSGNYYSYIKFFATSGVWEEIEVPLKDMFPSLRGRKLDLQNFSHDYIEEIAFLIGNKKQEKFKLLIDKIEVH